MVFPQSTNQNKITKPGACPGFLKGGGSNISWFPKKRSSDFKRGGSNGLKGGVQYICLTMTANLAYLDAKNELTCTLNLKYQ